MCPSLRSITILIDSLIEPRCTGMCGAFAIRLPSASKIAQEKSRRSLMLTECAVARSRSPICSATAMNRLEKTSSSTGSASAAGCPAVTSGVAVSSAAAAARPGLAGRQAGEQQVAAAR